MPGRYEKVVNRRTPEQELAFQMARSEALRAGSHTTELGGGGSESTGPSAQPGGGGKKMQPNPAYQGLSGIFNMVSDALGGTYQKEVPK